MHQCRPFFSLLALWLYPWRRDNPFHNFKHAFTVTHTAWRFLGHSPFLLSIFQSLDILAILLGGLTHDLDHNATNNAYHVNSQSALALQYNDRHCLVRGKSEMGGSRDERTAEAVCWK